MYYELLVYILESEKWGLVTKKGGICSSDGLHGTQIPEFLDMTLGSARIADGFNLPPYKNQLMTIYKDLPNRRRCFQSLHRVYLSV